MLRESKPNTWSFLVADSVQSHQREDSEGDDYQRDDDWQDNACKRRRTSFCCSPLPWCLCTWVRGTTSTSCRIPFTKPHWFPRPAPASTPHPRVLVSPRGGFGWAPGRRVRVHHLSRWDQSPWSTSAGFTPGVDHPQRFLWNCPAAGTIFGCTQRFLVFFFCFGKQDWSEIQRLKLLFLF